jgi:sodium transport system ATP-binding protein
MIQVRHLGKSFGRVTAVEGLSFDAPDGAITGLLGANGAGKTTTLRMISGVLSPNAGTIQLGTPCPRGDAVMARQRLGAFLDDHGLYPRLTAREHLAYFGRLRGMSGTFLEDRVSHVLSTLNLTTVADRRASGFSQGERMKVSLGCAMIHAPSHLLLDEPTNGLDVPTVRALRLWLTQWRDQGTCILLSSHILSEIEELCDRVVIVARGTVVTEGTLEQVRAQAEVEALEDAFVKITSAAEALPC